MGYLKFIFIIAYIIYVNLTLFELFKKIKINTIIYDKKSTVLSSASH